MRELQILDLTKTRVFNNKWSEGEKGARKWRELEKKISKTDFALSPHWKDFLLTTIKLKRIGVIRDEPENIDFL